MPLSDTISAVNCIPACPEMRAISDAQFFAYVIDRLATEAGIDLADITPGNLLDASEDLICDLQDRSVFSSVSPEVLKAITVYLVNQVTA